MPELFDGIGLVAVVMGCFGLTELLVQSQNPDAANAEPITVARLLPTRTDLQRAGLPFLRGSVIGFFMGLLPGSPGAATSLASYAAEKRLSKRKKEFGRGAVEGVAGPEAANNALAVSSMIPLFTLGIPTSATVAIMAGAFTINGLIPGPLLFRDNPDVAWAIIASLIVGNVILLILNVPLARVWIAVLQGPVPLPDGRHPRLHVPRHLQHQRQRLRHLDHGRRRRPRLPLPPGQDPAHAAGPGPHPRADARGQLPALARPVPRQTTPSSPTARSTRSCSSSSCWPLVVGVARPLVAGALQRRLAKPTAIKESVSS